MIRFSAILVAGAIAVLVAGVLATSLALVYLSIGVSVLALVLLVIGVILRREEIFGEAGRQPPAASMTGRSPRPPKHPQWSAAEPGSPSPAHGRPRLAGEQAEADGRAAEADGRPAEADGQRRRLTGGRPKSEPVPGTAALAHSPAGTR